MMMIIIIIPPMNVCVLKEMISAGDALPSLFVGLYACECELIEVA
jgi:hypothetical protein